MSIVVIPVRSRMSGVVACEPVAGTDIECRRDYPIPEELTAPSAHDRLEGCVERFDWPHRYLAVGPSRHVQWVLIGGP